MVFGGKSASLAGSIIDLATLSSTKVGFTMNSPYYGGQVGYSVSGAGDVNKDGFADVIVGAPFFAGFSGVSYVVFGSNSAGLAGSVIDLATLSSSKAGFTINGAYAYDNSGRFILLCFLTTIIILFLMEKTK